MAGADPPALSNVALWSVVERLARLAQKLPEDNWHDDLVTGSYRLALMRGVSAGHFIRKAAGTGLSVEEVEARALIEAAGVPLVFVNRQPINVDTLPDNQAGNGTPCTSTDPCLSNTICINGTCTGAPRASTRTTPGMPTGFG